MRAAKPQHAVSHDAQALNGNTIAAVDAPSLALPHGDPQTARSIAGLSFAASTRIKVSSCTSTSGT